MATNTFVGLPQPDSAHKPLLNLVDPTRALALRTALRSSSQSTRLFPAPVAESAVSDFATDPQLKPPRAHERGAFIRPKDRDRADSLTEEDLIRLAAKRAAFVQFALVLTSILDDEMNFQSAPASNLL